MTESTIDLSGQVTRLDVLDPEGHVDEALEPDIPDEDLRKLYETMVLAREFDERRLRLQQQGRIGTFAPVKGQEAAQLGSIYAIRSTDWFVPSFREMAAALWRGLDPADDLLYARGYEEGVKIPDDARDLPTAIPVASQLTHAAGLAWATRHLGEDAVALTYFGDGATSEGDFHEALNFAAVTQAPAIFLCQNNQWAISVPLTQQTRSKTIAQKALAYGMPGVQVDGNDILATYVATRDAVQRARDGAGPTLIEAVTYRMSVHTTADDPTRYRPKEEVEEWAKKDPIFRFRNYLERKNVLGEGDADRILEDAKARVRDAVERFEAQLDGAPADMFDHAYAELPPELVTQREELERGRVLREDGTVGPAPRGEAE